jgi:FkbM family methyltransferase
MVHVHAAGYRDRSREVWQRARWGAWRAKRAVETARALDESLRFLGTTARRRRVAADYTVRGHPIRLVHRSDDSWVFHEVFVDGFYDLPDDFPPPARIADLGGNIGMFALYTAIHWPEAEIVAFEPDPANAARYRWTMEHNRVRGRLIEACAAARDGTVSFAVGQESLAHITSDGSGTELPAVDAFPHLETADLIKMDIEGGEWPLLLDPRFAQLPASTVLMEYHPHLCPEPDARAAAISALTTAGYAPQPIFHDKENGVGMLRAFRSDAR